MTRARRDAGMAAEDLCERRLAERGWIVLARNERNRTGELDLVCIDAGTLVFVEVKSGHVGARAGPESPALAVGPAKQRRLRRLAERWIAAGRFKPHRFESVRFDVVGVLFGRDGMVADYTHLENAF